MVIVVVMAIVVVGLLGINSGGATTPCEVGGCR